MRTLISVLSVALALFSGARADTRCGWNWHDANYVCRSECTDDSACDGGMKCWKGLSGKACGAEDAVSDKRCGWSWDDANWTCRLACEPGSELVDCGGGMKCFEGLRMEPCGGQSSNSPYWNPSTSPSPSPSPAWQQPSPSPSTDWNPSPSPSPVWQQPSPSPSPAWQQPASGGTPGHSTRFWDCAKPSCAWPGRAPDSVKACAQDGVTVLDSGAMSAIDGGPAYACFDQQPYVSPSDPNLSYGTAALANDANCGKCFELTFTDGPVAGKRMVVRIVNQGTDVGAFQADIAMPGGGVGLFDACTKQFGSTPGARYGGVSSAAECGALPAPLQPGCRWRFEWFMGADNPSFVSREVSCGVLGD
jgi:Glycosyl hydrolase family 45